jgi:acetyltransferase-like isoleucine patch superfamily enzyme
MFYIPGSNRLYSGFLRLCMNFDYMGKRVIISPSCEIQRRAAPYIHLGDHVFLGKDVWLNIPYEAPPPVKNKPVIIIQRGTALGRRCTISGVHSIVIGEDVLFGPNVFVTDHSHSFENPNMPIMVQGISEAGSVIIEDGTWLGHGSCVIAQRGREVRIGKNSVIGANAVVTKSFPANSVLVGLPARNVGKVVR